MGSILLICVLSAGVEGSTERPFHELHQAMNDSLRAESEAKNQAQRGQAIRALCRLHREIVADSRFDKSDKLKEYRAKIWSRLTRAKAELKRQIAKESGRPIRDDESDETALHATDSLVASLSLADYSLGGPSYLLARGGGAVVGDNGQELVDLITRTINPNFWDVNGGPGAIVYYAPLQCLVISATGDVHGNIGGVLGGIRRAGR